MKLTKTQKAVFSALSAYPEYSDRQIADLLRLRRSTVTLARHALEKENIYKTYLFPTFQKLPIPFLGIIYGDYGKLGLIDYKKRMELCPEELKIPEYVFSFSSGLCGVSMCFGYSYASLKQPFDAWSGLFKSKDPSVMIEQVYIPREMVRTYKFFDAHPYLASLFGLDPLPVRKRSKKNRAPREKELSVLLAWMQNPEATNSTLSQKVNLSRTAIGAIKNRLLANDYARIIQVPEWLKLGLHLGVLLHLRFQPAASSLLEKLERTPEVVFLVRSDSEAVALSFFSDYSAYQQTIMGIVKELQQNKLLIDEPKQVLFSLQECQSTVNALPFLEKTLLKNKIVHKERGGQKQW